jgi:hypothetical protein
MKVGHAAAENGPRATLFALDVSCDEPAAQVQHGRMTLDVDAECERDVAAAQLGATAALDIGEYQTPGFACKPRHARIGPQDSEDALNDGGDRGVGVCLVKGREPGHGVLGNIRNGVGHDALLFGADELARLAGIVCGELLPLNDVEVVQSMPAIARLR